MVVTFCTPTVNPFLTLLSPCFPVSPAQSGWGGGSPSSPSVDDSTAGWGKPSDTPAFWGDPAEAAKSSGWGNPSPNPIKPGEPELEL